MRFQTYTYKYYLILYILFSQFSYSTLHYPYLEVYQQYDIYI